MRWPVLTTDSGVPESQIRTSYLLRCMSFSGSAATEKAFTTYHHVLRFYAAPGEFVGIVRSLWR